MGLLKKSIKGWVLNLGNVYVFEGLRVKPSIVWYPKSPVSFGQWLVAKRDFGVHVLQFYYRKISVAKQCKPLWGSQSEKFFFFKFSRVSPGDQPLAKEPED